MAIEVYMPQLGLTMTEGTVLKWLKKTGEMVRKGEALFEVETDKVVQEVTSLDEGVLLKLMVEEGKTVPVGTVIGYLGKAGEVLGDMERQGLPLPMGEGRGEGHSAQDSGRGTQDSPTPSEAGWVKASPAAKLLAKKLGVDLSAIKGTGPGGRILEADVRGAAELVAAKPVAEAPSSVLAKEAGEPSTLPIGKRIELKGARKVVAERMAVSFATAPHFYLTVEAKAGALKSLREQIEDAIERRFGVEPTITDLLIRATAVALREYPEANAAWIDGAIQRKTQINLGVAVAAEDGLVVPVIRDADKLSIGEIAQKRKELVQKARDSQLTLGDLEGGSFTLTNLGMFGIDQFQAILNPTQAAILATGRIKDRVVAEDDQVVVRPTMFVTLSVDHRILDGAQGAKFLSRVVELIEKPAELLLLAG